MTAYQFRHSHYCGECVAQVVANTPEFFDFIVTVGVLPERGSGDFDPARDLAALRNHFHIRTPDGDNFPVQVPNPEPPTLCCECLRWFDQVD